MNRYTLQSSRQVLDMAAGAIHIRAQIYAIESAIEQSPSFVFDLSKSLIDTVCKTILKDRAVSLPGKPASHELLNETLKVLNLHHEDIDKTKKTYDSLKKTANGLNTALSGICELRNRHGVIGHGQDGYALALECIQAQFVAGAADTIVHILYQSHKEYGDGAVKSRVFYENYESENIEIDNLYDDDSISEFIKKFRASEVLFLMDRASYQEAIDGLRNEDEEV